MKTVKSKNPNTDEELTHKIQELILDMENEAESNNEHSMVNIYRSLEEVLMTKKVPLEKIVEILTTIKEDYNGFLE